MSEIRYRTPDGEILDDYTAHERYRDMLDECYEPLRIGELEWLPSVALEQLDPVAFRCGFNDFTDAENWEEV